MANRDEGPPAASDASPIRRVWAEPLAAVFGWAVALTLFLWFFEPVSVVLLGLLAAGAVASLMCPAVEALPGPRGLRALAVGLAFLAALGGLLAGAVLMLAKQFAMRRE